ncbi:squalene/phytoene synthase family protein [Tepidiphilus baoligensis]|uniref:Squalene/phytoene synthase family protein n=1 Tax=Tepidiphilus baoligensis TaxID=2698687 RepID=A0ABX1QIV8_9PROT|nr:squalene/phytoene synthase family protein [Tepidiphilus baoligensis]NMH15951.1 squalene/phytoene synthase family protein [Tepidiphilus baoligensis]
MIPDIEHCRERLARRPNARYYSLLLLKGPRREALFVLYALIDALEDVVHSCRETQVTLTTLAWWANEVEAAFAGTPTHPITRALRLVLADMPWERAFFDELVLAARLRATTMRCASSAELQQLTYRLGAVPALLTVRALGGMEREAQQAAQELGMGLALAELLLGVGADARAGRILVPVEQLQRHDVPAEQILEGRWSESFAALMRAQAERVRHHFRAVDEMASPGMREALRPLMARRTVTEALLAEAEALDYRLLDRRLELPPLRQLWLTWRGWRRKPGR